MKAKEDLVVVTVRIPKSAVRAARALAQKQSKTISDVVGEALQRSEEAYSVSKQAAGYLEADAALHPSAIASA